MEAVLIVAETIFYFTVSLAIIVIGILVAMVTYHVIHIARELEGLSRNLHNASSEAGERINDIIDRLSDVPFLSYFLKRYPPAHKEKGRRK